MHLDPSKKKIIVFENDNLKNINIDGEKFEYIYVCPAAYFKNSQNYPLNFSKFGISFNKYIKDNFNSFSSSINISKENLKKFNLDKISYETIYNLILPIISVYYFSTYDLNKENSFFIHNNNLIKIDKSNMNKYLSKFLLDNNQLIFVKDRSKKQYFSKIIFFLNNSIFYFLKKKKFVLIQDNNYGFNEIIKREKKTIFVKFIQLNKYNLIQSLISFLKTIFKFSNTINLSIPILNKSKNKDKNIRIFDHINNELSSVTVEPFNFILSHINLINNNFKQNIKDKFLPEFSLFHNVKWMEDIIISQCPCKKSSYLSSHSSHPIPTNEISSYLLKDLSKGMLYTDFIDKFLIQSQSSYASYNKFEYPKNKLIKVKPFVWGYKKPHYKNLNRTKVKLLHASTFKLRAFRPFIYENSNLYFLKLNKLCELISQTSKLELIIRPCVNKELELDNYNKMLTYHNYKNISLSIKKSFIDDINISDLLLSFSSTTIEESIYLNKKVILLSSPDEHKHFSNNNLVDEMDILNISSKNFEDKVLSFLNLEFKYDNDKYDYDIKNLFNEK